MRFAKGSDRRFAALLFLSALVIRVGFVLIVESPPISDMRFYYEQGVSIAQGTGYVSDGAVNGYQYPLFPAGAPTADRPVGYSAFLGLLFRILGPSVTVGVLANALLSSLTILLSYRVARYLTRSLDVSRIAAVVLVCFPNQIAYCSLLSDSILFQFLLILALWIVLRRSRWFAVLALGVIAGLLTLTRAYGLLLPVLWGILRWRPLGWQGVASRVALTFLGVALVVSPWTVRNYRAFGDFALVSTNFGHNLLAGHNERCKGQWDPKLPAAAYEPGFRNEVERDHALRKLALAYVIDHPLRTVAMAFPKVFYMYADDADGLRWIIKSRHLSSDQASSNADSTEPAPQPYKAVKFTLVHYTGMAVFEGYYLVVMLGFVGALIAKLRGRLRDLDSESLGLWAIAYFTLIAVVFFGMSRFHYPLVPILTLYASAFYVDLWQRWRGRTGTRRAPVIASVAA